MEQHTSSPLFPQGDFHLVSLIDKYSRIVIDEAGQYWLQHRFPKEGFEVKKNKSIFSFPCNSICDKDCRRPHLGDPKCRLRAALKGELPEFIRVRPVTYWVWQDRPWAWLKDHILTILSTIYEMVAAK